MTATTMTTGVVAWLLTYAIHSSLLLAAAWLVTRALAGRRLALQELIWRTAVIGGLVTASLQLALGLGPQPLQLGRTAAAPAPQRFEVPVPAAHAAETAPALNPARSTVDEPAPTAPAWPWALLAPWLLGAALGAARLLGAVRGLRALLADRLPLVSGSLAAALHRLLELLPRPPTVRLSSSPAVPVPIALGVRRPEICVPARALTDLPAPQQEGLCAHELAHLVRRDPAWSAVLSIVEAVLFFQPLNRLARRQLAELAELRCDAWAARITGRGRDLARCLATVAEWSHGMGSCPLPAASLLGSGRLARRVHRLVKGAPDGDPGPRRHAAVPLAGATLLVLTLVLPGATTARGAADGAPHPAPVATPAPAAPASPAPAAAPAATAPAQAPAAELKPVAEPAPLPELSPVSEPVPVTESARARHDHDRTIHTPDNADLDPATDAEMERLEAEINQLSEELAKKVAAQMQRLNKADFVNQEAIQKAQEEIAARHAEMAAELEHEMSRIKLSQPDQEKLEADMERLSREVERLSKEAADERGEPGDRARTRRELAERSRELAERSRELAERIRPSEEQLHQIREKARAMAEALRPSEAELQELRDHARAMAEQLRPNQEELQRLREEIRERSRHLQELARRLAHEQSLPAPAPEPEASEPPEPPQPPNLPRR